MEQTSGGTTDVELQSVPRHVAIIMDGNGRWARSRRKPRHSGHRAGIKSVRATVETAAERGVKFLTLFAFSSENWRRPAEEVSTLMNLFIEALQREVAELHRNKVRLRFIGARETLTDRLRQKIEEAERITNGNDGLTLLIAVSYGGHWDIVNAARNLASEVKDGLIAPEDIDEGRFETRLALAGVPDPDLLIRTGGEQRISNFLLWNLAYAELYFCDCYWPDFSGAEFDAAIRHFAQRQRRYGCTGEQIGAE
ncbi:MAG: isoprenyl transferase [Woeseia sp.]